MVFDFWGFNVSVQAWCFASLAGSTEPQLQTAAVVAGVLSAVHSSAAARLCCNAGKESTIAASESYCVGFGTCMCVVVAM